MIYLVRHGQTEANAARLIQGQSDRPLTDLGRRQAAALAAVLAVALPAGAPVVTSPLRRARETAAAIGPAGAAAIVDDRWIEIDYGDFEGKPIDDVRHLAQTGWAEDVHWAPPNGESMASAAARVAAACDELLARAPADVIVVTHVNPIKLAVAWALAASPRIGFRMFVHLASITTIAVSADGRPVLTGFSALPGSGTGGTAG